MSQGRRVVSSKNTPLEQIHASMKTTNPVIKNANKARIHLYNKGWALPGEDISLEIIARTLFSVVAAAGKISADTVNPILAAAYIITEEIEDNIKENIAESITKHLLESLLPITTNLQSKIESHLQAVNDTTKVHTEITEKLQHTQERLEVTSEKVESKVKSYSQAAATPAPPTTHQQYQTPTNNPTYAHHQLRNRKDIKC
jgi:hypothetical protein